MSAYRGSWGQTRTESVHVPLSSGDIASVTVWRAINVDRDPALAARLEAGTLNRVTLPDGSQTSVDVPVLIHHEGRALTLLLSPALRHRELAERAAVLTALALALLAGFGLQRLIDAGRAVAGYPWRIGLLAAATALVVAPLAFIRLAARSTLPPILLENGITPEQLAPLRPDRAVA